MIDMIYNTYLIMYIYMHDDDNNYNDIYNI